MCGIVGLVSNKKNIDISIALASLNHRGPDFKNQHTLYQSSRYVTFGQTRLGIIDLNNTESNQPLYDDRYMMIFNGEIYNYQELANKYLSNNDFKSDTVVLFELLKKDLSLIHKLKGMFAIAFYDSRENKLHLFSDDFGKKPIYYAHKNGNFYFSSEIKALKAFNDIDFSTLSKSALFSYLSYNYTPIEQSIYYEIKKLDGGSHITYDVKMNTLKKDKYFDLYVQKVKAKEMAFDYSHFKDIITEAVRRRYVADVDVAIQLSSGIDSTLVGAISKHLLGFEPHAFTVGIEKSIQSESDEAKKIAKDLNFKHDVFYIEPKDFFEIMKIHTDIYDEPFADSSSIPTYFLNKKVYELGYRVLLTGDGGDEFWLGYNRYVHARIIEKLYKFPFLKNSLKNIFSKPIIQKLVYILLKHKYDFRQFDYRLSQILRILETNNSSEYYELLVNQGNNKKLINYDLSTYSLFQSSDILNQISTTDSKHYMQGDIFVKNDRASMANSIEARSPLVDIDLVKYALSIKNNEKLVKKQTKYPLRKLLKEVYPEYNFDMPKKGFGIPLFDWLKIDYIKLEVIETIANLYKYEAFDSNYIRMVLCAFYEEGKPNAYQIWNLYLLAQFLVKNNFERIELK